MNVLIIFLAMQTEKCGWGLVADEDIKAGSFLIEYVGEGELRLSCENILKFIQRVCVSLKLQFSRFQTDIENKVHERLSHVFK